MGKTRFALFGLLFSLVGSAVACAPGTGDAEEGTGETTHRLLREVVAPRAAGGGKRFARSASHETPAKRHAGGLERSTKPSGRKSRIALRANTGALPETVDLSEDTPPIPNQGNTSACVTFSLGYSAMGWWAKRRGLGGAPYSTMFLYSQIVQGDCLRGTEFEDSLNILSSQGIPPARVYEPMESSLDCNSQPSRFAKLQARHTRVKDWMEIDLQENPQEAIKQALASGVPVVLGISMYSAVNNANADAFLIDAPYEGDTSTGLHAVTAYAYDEAGVWFANSWGEEWGLNGWGELSWEYVNGVHDGYSNMSGAFAITDVE